MSKFQGNSEARPLPGVTADNYIIPSDDGNFREAKGKAMEYARAAGQCFMILPTMYQHQMIWRNYFHLKHMHGRARQMAKWLKDKGQFAVPSEYPWQFDQSVSEEQCR